jgi:hypothetical protein
MPHQRTLIRRAVVAQFLGQTDAGQRVFPTRIVPLRTTELPAISVYTLEDTVSADSSTTGPRTLIRDLPIQIEGWVKANDNVDDAMDELAFQVETAMHRDQYLGGTVGDSILDTTVMEVVEEGGRLLGLVVLTYVATYRTMAPEEPAEPDKFITADTTRMVVGGVPDTEQHRDEVVVQEIPGP